MNLIKYMGIILGREIHFVEPKLTIHNSEIKNQQKKYIPSDVIKILEEYNNINKER